MDTEIIALKDEIGNRVCTLEKLPNVKVSLDNNKNFILEVPSNGEGGSPKIVRTSHNEDELDGRHIIYEEQFYKNT